MSRGLPRPPTHPTRSLRSLALPLAAVALALASAALLWSSLRGELGGRGTALEPGMRGVPVAADSPYHDDTSKSFTPASPSVGTSGNDSMRVPRVTASSRSVPAFTCCE